MRPREEKNNARLAMEPREDKTSYELAVEERRRAPLRHDDVNTVRGIALARTAGACVDCVPRERLRRGELASRVPVSGAIRVASEGGRSAGHVVARA
jgi:hypothetical protein